MNYNEEACSILLRKAKQKFETAEYTLSKGFLDSCVSDLYYSAFQTVIALMVLKGESSSKHVRVRQWANL